MNGDAGRGELTATLWLFLLKAGGRWLASDVARKTGKNSADVGQMLPGMARADNVRKYPLAGKVRRFTYGVTGACKVPRCVNVQQIADCVTVQAPDREEVEA